MAAERENQFNMGGVDSRFCQNKWASYLFVEPVSGSRRPTSAGPAFTREDKHGARPVAVISYGLWQRRFNGAQDVLQRQIRLDSENYDIVGVMPPGFAYPERKVDVWVPVQHVLDSETIASRGSHQFTQWLASAMGSASGRR